MNFCSLLIYVTLKKGKKVSYNRYPKIKNPHQYADKGFNVGVEGFEPPTPCSQSRCANRTALHPENNFKSRRNYEN